MLINYGNAYHTFCEGCSTTDTAQEIQKSDKGLDEAEIATEDNINIPLHRTAIGILVITAVFGPIYFLLYQLLKYN